MLNKISVFTAYVLLSLSGCWGLRDVQLRMPEAAERGGSVRLRCEYDLEFEYLYQVKWYRGDREFCRYSPRDVPPMKIFPIRGITVDRKRSDSRHLTMENVTKVSEGGYTCEVSADSPSFATARVNGFMYVVDLPQKRPKLIGLRDSYKVGMQLKAECYVKDSMPAANLSFFLNDERVSSQHVWHRVDGENDGLLTAYINIQFVVHNDHFKEDRLRLRCTAMIYDIYQKSIEKSCMREHVLTTTTRKPAQRGVFVYSMQHTRKPKVITTLSTPASSSQAAVSLVLLVLPAAVVK